ncbi:MAG: cytochrome P450 [Acetobacteraceae bacterium]|nr:cytochrome P450 [Acetobacteraceae bacterium]
MAGLELYKPPIPEIPEKVSFFGFVRAVRSNAVRMWPRSAYEQEMVIDRQLTRTVILANAPDAIHHVLVENAQNYRRTPASIRVIRPIVGEGLLLSQGETWRHQRRTIAPALAARVVPILARHMAAVAAETVSSLTAESGPINLLATMQRVALDIAGRSMFSLEMHAQGPAMRDHLLRYGMHLARPYFLDLFLPISIPTPHDFARRRFQAEWMGFIDALVEARLQHPQPEKPRDLFDLMRAARDPETGAAFTREVLRDQTATMIVAGHETTALTLFWACFLLAHVPEAQQRVAAEASSCDLSPEHAGEALQFLPFTRAVVSESLRLYPPAFALARQAIADDQWRDIPIRRGAAVLIAPWVLHRHRRLWRDPDAFDPERFVPGAPQPPRYAYLPFGTGPRICVGAQFALTEATLVLAALVRSFHLTCIGEKPVLPMPVITLQPNYPPPFLLQPRIGLTPAGPRAVAHAA